MNKRDIIYIPGQDFWSEQFSTPGKPKPNNISSDSQAQYNKLLRSQQKLRNRKK